MKRKKSLIYSSDGINIIARKLFVLNVLKFWYKVTCDIRDYTRRDNWSRFSVSLNPEKLNLYNFWPYSYIP